MKGNSSALRKGRFSEPGRIYLVTCTTNNRQVIFNNLKHGRMLVDVLRKESAFTDTLAFVIMPDHLHWLIQLKGKSLSDTVQTVKSVSSHTLKQAMSIDGLVWQDGFHDRALRKEEDLKNMARYIVLNPVRAGLVSSVREYSFWDAVWV